MGNTIVEVYCETPEKLGRAQEEVMVALNNEGVNDFSLYGYRAYTISPHNIPQDVKIRSFRVKMEGPGRTEELKEVLLPLQKKGLITEFRDVRW